MSGIINRFFHRLKIRLEEAPPEQEGAWHTVPKIKQQVLTVNIKIQSFIENLFTNIICLSYKQESRHCPSFPANFCHTHKAHPTGTTGRASPLIPRIEI